jgi:hypothetical protein
MRYVLNLAGMLKGKYVKAALLKLEEKGPLDPEVRKIVLDAFNDMYREFRQTLEKDQT